MAVESTVFLIVGNTLITRLWLHVFASAKESAADAMCLCLCPQHATEAVCFREGRKAFRPSVVRPLTPVLRDAIFPYLMEGFQ